MKSLEIDSRIEIDRGEIVNDIYSVSIQCGDFSQHKELFIETGRFVENTLTVC